MTDFLGSLFSVQILAQGLRGAAFLRLRIEDSEASFSRLVGLIAVTIAVQFALDFYSVGPQGELSPYGLPGLLFKVPAILIAACALSLLARKPEATLKLAVAISAIAIPIGIFGDLLLRTLDSPLIGRHFHLQDSYYLLYAHLAPAWLGLAAAVAAARLFDFSGKKVALCALSGVVLIWFPLALAGGYRTIWAAPYDAEATARERAQRNVLLEERVFYSQPRLLEHALAALDRSQPDRINLYFVGVAGYSEQDVFMKEVHYVSNFFKARFGTTGRSITLINNPNTVLESPAASVTSLRLALNQVGKMMDTEKDILFLYLTSHGSREHRLSLSFGSMRFDVLDPLVLRRILDDSGIKRRVVVVSSCYSGGFVEPLKNENTLVISASAPDKTSHGCSNEADFTFFGKAYFEDGLRRTDSFIDAFNVASPLIADRDAKEGYEPAQPMMSVGTGIRAALNQFTAEQKQYASQRSTATRAEAGPEVLPNQSPLGCASCQ